MSKRLNTGIASRLMTADRPMTKGGYFGGAALNQQLKVEDRTITQQGIGGLKTAKGSRRLVEDKNYYLGLLRSKINEISKELTTLNQRMQEAQEESEGFLQYEQMAEKSALEIKNLQGELGDYNTLVDKMNMNDDIKALEIDYEDIKAENERAERLLEHLFEDKNAKESEYKSIDIELEQERQMAETLVSNMPIELRNRFEKAKEENVHYIKKMGEMQDKIDKLHVKRMDFEEELEQSYIKKQAMKLYSELADVESKRNKLAEEEKLRGDPQQEREKLLKQMKDDNVEIAAIERQINECQDRLEIIQDELGAVERDIDDNQGEKMQKYRDLKKREEQIDEFLNNFEQNKEMEFNKLDNLEEEVTNMLEKLSKNMSRMGHIPTEEELLQVQDQLTFKTSEVSKSEQTTSGLSMERTKLVQDLAKVDQMDGRFNAEKKALTTKIEEMEKNIVKYSDLEKLKENTEEVKQRLHFEKESLTRRREYMKKQNQYKAKQYEISRAQLDENDTQVQLINLEKKWQHLEQNNYVMREFISTKSVESDYVTLSNQVKKLLEGFNDELKESIAGKSL